LPGQNKVKVFEETFIPHLDAAYNLARWLTRSDDDAQDVVQEAYLRALKFYDGFHGGESRAWLLTIVRNTCYTWLQQNRSRELATAFDEEIHAGESDNFNPVAHMMQKADGHLLKQALEELPLEFREAIVLRELEGFSYKQIADVTGVPIGTVMSRLARARTRLQRFLIDRIDKEG
jgi:RNA polymerase sigma-70 factor (ECF subfamily)